MQTAKEITKPKVPNPQPNKLTAQRILLPGHKVHNPKETTLAVHPQPNLPLHPPISLAVPPTKAVLLLALKRQPQLIIS
jgi:hypothetical protein